jgi:hypothetical protein
VNLAKLTPAVGLAAKGLFGIFFSLICCICSHFGFLQFFLNDDMAHINWML